MKAGPHFAAACFILLAKTGWTADADNGADLFDANCAECHSVSSSMKIKRGPSLFRIVGRSSGTQSGFDYSPGMANLNLTWDAAVLDRYITAPKAMVPGGNMKFDGLTSAKERADVIAFLMQQK